MGKRTRTGERPRTTQATKAGTRRPAVPLPAALALAALLLAALLAAAVSAAPAGAAVSATPDPGTWVTNGAVSAIATAADGTTYIGGDFTYVGPNTGGGAPLDASGSVVGTPLPIAGTLHATAADGSGGFYIGGSFTSVGGEARSNLAHILADGSLDLSWGPSANSTVYALAVSGGTVYAAGAFASIDGVSRSRIAALDATSGAATAWDPSANDTVRTLAVSGGTVYAAGAFTSIDGVSRSRIAALDAASGAATAWDPSANSTVLALAVSGETVYAGGYFTTIGGASRSRIAALDAASGDATAWDPSADQVIYALAVSGGTVYAGGYFTTIGGASRGRIAALDAATGAATAWDPSADGFVDALAVSGGIVYAGGHFTTIGGSSRGRIAAFHSEFTITPSVVGGASGHGAISPDAPQTVEEGATPTFTFTSDAGYETDQVLVDGSPVTPTAENEYTFPAVAADHTISVSFAASAGPPPVTTVSGAVRGWSKRPVTLRFTAVPAPGGAAVAYTEYRLGDGEWRQGTRLRLTRQGTTRVAYRSVDVLGDVEGARVVPVRIDTRRPRVVARSATGRAGSIVRLRYKVGDPRPGCARALVRLVVVDSSGHALTRASTRPAPANAWRTLRVSTRALAPGAYTVVLRAVDIAGNFQRGVTRTRLTVR